MGTASVRPMTPPPLRGTSPASPGEETASLLHSPITALAMMLRWISFEPA